jgi:hypothetical protein
MEATPDLIHPESGRMDFHKKIHGIPGFLGCVALIEKSDSSIQLMIGDDQAAERHRAVPDTALWICR